MLEKQFGWEVDDDEEKNDEDEKNQQNDLGVESVFYELVIHFDIVVELKHLVREISPVNAGCDYTHCEQPAAENEVQHFVS